MNATTALLLIVMLGLARYSPLVPLPICSVPPATVVGPLYVLEPDITISPGPALLTAMPPRPGKSVTAPLTSRSYGAEASWATVKGNVGPELTNSTFDEMSEPPGEALMFTPPVV